MKSRPPSNREIRDAQLGPQLEAIWKKNYSVYGKRKLVKAALRAGLEIGRDQVARLMKRQGIRGASRAKKRFTTHADATHLRAPDLVKRDFTATRPDQLWVADFTYCSTWSGVVYVAFIIDVFSRRLVGWKASRSMTASLVVDALNICPEARKQLNDRVNVGANHLLKLRTIKGNNWHLDTSTQHAWRIAQPSDVTHIELSNVGQPHFEHSNPFNTNAESQNAFEP